MVLKIKNKTCLNIYWNLLLLFRHTNMMWHISFTVCVWHSDPHCLRKKRLLNELRKRRSLDAIRLGVKIRRKRYNYADYHDWDEDPGNYDYEDPKTSMSYVDKIKENGNAIITLTAIVMGILMCCFVTCVLPCLRFCGECCSCCKTNCLMCYDCIVCRDPKYRILQSIGEKTGMQMPDYNSYIMMREVYGEAAKEVAQEAAQGGAFF
ncbi:unnamed protein product [Owenia fusiformis]|uniref:Uncharacterized protein n=1 Tax=Owenia fusiformis TaxID=6347 RepID=A0A8S4P727_OWEFU|nr:unnamed protein product [Owenia fusiformis]